MTDINDSSKRYAPPTADVSAVAPAASALEPAGRWRRFFNFALDYIAFIVLSGLIGVVMGIVGVGEAFLQSGKGGEMLFGLIVILAYYLLTEGLTGRSVGKLVTGTQVVTADGGSPRFGQMLGRTLMRFVPFEFVSVFRDGGLMWHDSVSGTRVVMRRSLG